MKKYILSENGDISFFKTLKGLISYIEPIDVKNGEYTLFDSDGRVIKLGVIKNNDKEKIIATNTEIKDTKSLYLLLFRLCEYIKEHRRFIDKISHIDCNDQSLQQMIDILTELIGFED